MNIRTVTINKKGALPFLPFIAEAERDFLGYHGYFFIGAVADSGQGEFAAGVLEFFARRDHVIIKKLDVMDDDAGIKEALYDELNRICKRLNISVLKGFDEAGDIPDITIEEVKAAAYPGMELLDPYHRRDRIELAGGFLLLARDEKKQCAAGVFVVTTADQGLFIEWANISPEYRGYGIGKRMVQYLIEEAKKKKLSEMSVVFKKSDMEDVLGRDPEEFFKIMGFMERQPLPAHFESKLSLLSDDKRHPGVITLSELDNIKLEYLEELLKKESSRLLPYTPGEVMELSDPQLSVVKLSKEGFLAGLFIHTCGERIYPFLLLEERGGDVGVLIHEAIHRANSIMPLKSPIVIDCTKTRSEELIKSLPYSFSSTVVYERILYL